jgi:HAD superfamily phosphatase (TIGR01681 family)
MNEIDVFIFDLDETLYDWSSNRLFPQARDIIENLHANGYKIALASYNRKATDVLMNSGLAQFFHVVEWEDATDYKEWVKKHIVDADEKDLWKYRRLYMDNKKRMLSSIIKKLETTPERCVFLDDQKRNIECARNMGIHAVRVGKDGVEWRTILDVTQFIKKIEKGFIKKRL